MTDEDKSQQGFNYKLMDKVIFLPFIFGNAMGLMFGERSIVGIILIAVSNTGLLMYFAWRFLPPAVLFGVNIAVFTGIFVDKFTAYSVLITVMLAVAAGIAVGVFLHRGKYKL